MQQPISWTSIARADVDAIEHFKSELIRVHRELQSCSGCCCCGSCEGCMQQVTVECPPGQIIGIVQQEY
ncbi:unnamed protein product [Rotaria sp. Silwood2]|nr:unnamed protein product [Rotaria sp. Silwood2]